MVNLPASLSALVENAVVELPRGKLRVAFSGGLDSTVLLHATAGRLRELGELDRLTAHHMHHGLEAESAAWLEHCRVYAAELDVQFECDHLSLPSKGNMERHARQARYARWAEVLVEGETLLLAHHARDQAETLLMRLMRGASGSLLRGMPRERDIAEGQLLRPFLRLSHKAIEDYAQDHGLSWCEDPSNQALDKDRSFVRHKLLPMFESRWPDAVAALSGSSEALDREYGAFDALLSGSLEAVLEGGPGIAASVLLSLSKEAQLPVLRRALAHMGVHSLSEFHLNEILRQAALPKDRTVDFRLLGGRHLARFAGRLVVYGIQPLGTRERQAWNLREAKALPHGELSAIADCSQEAACLPGEIGELEVRFRVGGERLRIRGMRRKVSQLFQEAGVAIWLRDDWPLIFLEGDLVMVPGIAIDDALACDRGWLIQWFPS